MKTILMVCFFVTSVFAKTNAQDLQEKLLGKWKLTKDEGYEFFINSLAAQTRPQDEMDKFYYLIERLHNQTFKNFYSKDSMTSTILDRNEIIQEKSAVYEYKKADYSFFYVRNCKITLGSCVHQISNRQSTG